MRSNPTYFWLMVTFVSFVVAGIREEVWRAGTLAAMRALWPRAFDSRTGQCLAISLIAVGFGLHAFANGSARRGPRGDPWVAPRDHHGPAQIDLASGHRSRLVRRHQPGAAPMVEPKNSSTCAEKGQKPGAAQFYLVGTALRCPLSFDAKGALRGLRSAATRPRLQLWSSPRRIHLQGHALASVNVAARGAW